MDTDILRSADQPERLPDQKDLRERPTVPPPSSQPDPSSGAFLTVPAAVVLEAVKKARG
jgi:hypothetical protein